MEDKNIICTQCGNLFTLTAAQQERLIRLRFSEPKRCRECRNKKAKVGLSRYEEKMRHKNRHLKNQWTHLYNLRRVRDSLMVADTREKYRWSREKGCLET